MNLLSYVFNAIWPLVWHFGTGVGVIIIGVLIWWFTPFKQTGLAIAVGAGLFLGGMSVGVVDEKHRWEVKEQAALKRGQDARGQAEDWVRKHPPAAKRPRWRLPNYGVDYNRD